MKRRPASAPRTGGQPSLFPARGAFLSPAVQQVPVRKPFVHFPILEAGDRRPSPPAERFDEITQTLFRRQVPASEPGDASEQQADRIAARVQRDRARASVPTAQAPPLPRHMFVRGATPLSSGGDPLPLAVRRFYEPRFGQSLTDVRVHTGPAATSYAGALQAQAFTYGDHIWMGAGRSVLPSMLLAHEIAHVAQQRATGQWLIARKPDEPGVAQMAKARPTAQSDFVLHAGNDDFVVSFELLPTAGAGGDVRVVISPRNFSRAYESQMKYFDVRGREVGKDDSFTSMANHSVPAAPRIQQFAIADRTKFDPVMKELPEKSGTVWTFDLNGDAKPDFAIRVDFKTSNVIRDYDFTTSDNSNVKKFGFHFIQDDAWKYGYQGNSSPRRKQDDFFDTLGDILSSKTTWEMAITMIPVIGEIVLLGEALTGYTIFGDKMSTTERVVSGLAALLPVAAGAIAKGVARGGADLVKVAAKVGRSEEEVIALLRAAEKQSGEAATMEQWRATLKAGGKLTADEVAKLQLTIRQLEADERALRAADQEARAISRQKPAMTATSSPLEGGGEFTMEFMRDLSGTARGIVRQLEKRGWVRVSEIAKDDLVQISKWFEREVAVVQSPYGRLRVVLGTKNGIIYGQLEKGEVFVVHTHPVFRSHQGHFDVDLANAGKHVEAAIDWSGNVIYFSKSGIKNPRNVAGFLDPLLGYEAAFLDEAGNIVGFSKVDLIDTANGTIVKVRE
jgi:hypothetical protein